MMRNILVLIDFHDPLAELTNYSLKLAGTFQSSCWLLHVAAPDPEFVGYEPGPQYIRDHRAGELKTEHMALEQLRHEFIEKGIPCQILLIQGDPIKVIQSEIDKRSIDLVIMGHHHKSSIREWIAGSVGKEVLRHAGIPMLIVPFKVKA